MRLVGTAGHVDHGKSTLVHALTGIHPDRLKEEQVREMTIDLGFAWLTLPHGETISLVDVPGHEAFIKNMLAGAGGMDAALLVIAADEGIMPQTREHLAILDLLRIQGGVVALTKTDLSFDAGWLELIQTEIRAALKNTALADAPIIPVSAKTKRGLTELQLALEQTLTRVTEKTDRGKPRLPVDRVFTMSGFGTVVTGTLSDGHFQVGDEVEIAPSGLRSRIRGLQTHKQKLETALPGGRAAINLANVATDELKRGDVVVFPNTYSPTTVLDAHIEWLPSAPKPLAHSQELELFLFSAQVTARIRLLDKDTLAPGESGWAQLILDTPIITAKGDRFILRYPSPSITVGGGQVVEPHPRARHQRKHPAVMAQLARAQEGTPSELVQQFVETHPGSSASEISDGVGLHKEIARSALRELTATGNLVTSNQLPEPLYIAREMWTRWREKMTSQLDAYHKQFPLRAGMPRQEFKSRLNFTPRLFELALTLAASENLLRVTEKHVALASHHIAFDPMTQQKVNLLLEQFARTPYNPPSVSEVESALGLEVLNALVEQGILERIAPNVLLAPAVVSEMQAWVLQTLTANREITAAQLRDRFDTSRKYAIAFLEYLDARRITTRVGDVRVLR